MRYWLIAVAVLWGAILAFDKPSEAYTCDDVRNAVRTMSKEQLEAIMKQMTPEQLAAAKRCLKGS